MNTSTSPLCNLRARDYLLAGGVAFCILLAGHSFAKGFRCYDHAFHSAFCLFANSLRCYDHTSQHRAGGLGAGGWGHSLIPPPIPVRPAKDFFLCAYSGRIEGIPVRHPRGERPRDRNCTHATAARCARGRDGGGEEVATWAWQAATTFEYSSYAICFPTPSLSPLLPTVSFSSDLLFSCNLLTVVPRSSSLFGSVFLILWLRCPSHALLTHLLSYTQSLIAFERIVPLFMLCSCIYEYHFFGVVRT